MWSKHSELLPSRWPVTTMFPKPGVGTHGSPYLTSWLSLTEWVTLPLVCSAPRAPPSLGFPPTSRHCTWASPFLQRLNVEAPGPSPRAFSNCPQFLVSSWLQKHPWTDASKLYACGLSSPLNARPAPRPAPVTSHLGTSGVWNLPHPSSES